MKRKTCGFVGQTPLDEASLFLHFFVFPIIRRAGKKVSKKHLFFGGICHRVIGCHYTGIEERGGASLAVSGICSAIDATAKRRTNIHLRREKRKKERGKGGEVWEGNCHFPRASGNSAVNLLPGGKG